jgi:16S rRNA (adenine1518-N6/adenine1519-N6)-dimethyltransferase
VQSALVRLVPLEQPLDRGAERFADVVRRAFSARRKTLRNALGLAPEEFAALGIDPRLRPENLSPQDYARIARRSISQFG